MSVLRVAQDAAGAARGGRGAAGDQATESGLRYRHWVEERRDYVAKASNGRLGYVHMPDMGRRR